MSVSGSSHTASSEQSGPSSSRADRFPRSAGEPINEGRCDNGPISAHSALPFPQTVAYESLVNGNQTKRQNPLADSTLVAMVNGNQQGNSLSRRKSQFYGEVFAYREPNFTARDRIHQYSVITVEVKTNVIVSSLCFTTGEGRKLILSDQVKDEYIFLADLSQHLSQRYHRPISSIFVTLSHSACLLFAGTFDSAYILTVTALPSQIQPTTNKRNAALIQKFMIDSLGVPPERGVVRFVGIPEEFLATNGMTVLGEIENLRKTSSEDSHTESSRLGTIRTRSRRTPKPQGLALEDENGLKSGAASFTLPLQSPSPPLLSTKKSHLSIKAEKVKKMGRRRSFMALFGK